VITARSNYHLYSINVSCWPKPLPRDVRVESAFAVKARVIADPGAMLAQNRTRAGWLAFPIRPAKRQVTMVGSVEQQGSKVPEVTLVFWIIKIAATTLGETFGDTVTMTLNWGYLVGAAIFFSLLIALVVWQTVVDRFHPFLYWATIIASTTAGTTMADFADRSLGIGYAGGSLFLLVCLMVVLAMWYWSLGSISVATVTTPKVEAFYWAAITFSQTLGTALGDWMADDTGLGYEGGALIFAASLALLATAYFCTNVSRVFLFWAAFILSRPLGATVGDFLDKPVSDGGLALSRPIASAVIAVFIVACLIVLPQRAGQHPNQSGIAS
jgi:uncharacterized membrane-anchored protein